MINLYIDFDGVIMDTITSSYAKMEKLGIHPKETDKVIAFYQKLDWKHFLLQTREINNAFAEIEKLMKSGLFHVQVLTHITSLEEAKAKTEFIQSKIGNLPIITVPKRIEKTMMVDAKDAILIDDYTGNLACWQKEGGIGVRFSTKLHGKGYPVIDHLTHILSFVKEGIL